MTANIPNVVVPLVASAARTVSGNTGNLKDTAANIPLCETMAVYLNVTASSLGLGGLTVSIDTSPDGGTTWFTAAAFSPIIGGVAGVVTRRMDFHQGLFVGEVATEQSASYSFGGAQGQGTHGNTPLTRDNRVSWDLVGTTATFSVWAICVPYGQRS